MNALKKFVLIPLGIIVILLVLTGIVLRAIFTDDKLREIVEPLLESSLERDVSIGAARISLFRTFPRISVGVEELVVHTPDGPDLASVEALWAATPLRSLFGDALRIETIELIGPTLLIETLADGRTTLDGLGGTEAAADTTAEAASGTIQLDRLSIRDGAFAYIDGAGTLMSVADLDADLRIFLGETTNVAGYVEAYDVVYETAGTAYAAGWDLRLDVDAVADLAAETLTLAGTRLRAEQLDIAMEGAVAAWSADPMQVDLRMATSGATLEGFLSLLPRGLVQDLDGVTARGPFSFSATLAGDYGTDAMPRFDGRLALSDGFVQYPGLPEAISGIHLDAQITDEAIRVERLTAEAAGNRLAMEATIQNGDRPTVDAQLTVAADLATLPRFYPLEAGTDVAGRIDADARLQGAADDPASLRGEGEVALVGIRYASPALPQPVDDLNGRIRLDNDAIRIDGLRFRAGASDATLDGAMTDYLAMLGAPTAERVPTFTGTLRSDRLVLDELIPEDTTDSGPIVFPDLVVDVDYQVDALTYGPMRVENARSTLALRDQVLSVSGISAGFLEGTLAGALSFDASSPERPGIEGGLALTSVKADRFFTSMDRLGAFARLGTYFDGLFDSEASFSMRMDEALSPVLETVQASGAFGAREGSLAHLPVMDRLADYLNIADLASLQIDNWSHAFVVAGEQLQLRDLTLDAGPFSARLNGTQSLGGEIDYTLSVLLPASVSDQLMASAAGSAIRPLAGAAQAALVDPESGRIVVDLVADGTFTDPAVRVNTAMMRTRLETHASALVAGARREAEARLDSLANAQREALEAEARERLGNLVGEAADSSTLAVPPLDSLKEQGADVVRDRLKGLINRRRGNN